MRGSLYLEQEKVSPASKLSTIHPVKWIASMMMALLAFVSVGGAMFIGMASQGPKHEAYAMDWIKFISCDILESPAPEIYQYTQTPDLVFLMRSKSVITSGASNVDNGFNWLLSATGESFTDINTPIVGYSMAPQEDSEAEDRTETVDPEEKYNKGIAVSPYDRFGIAGLHWTGYQGEWRYVTADACGDGEPFDPLAASFYEDRLEPMSVYEDIGKSNDPRTQQFSISTIPTFMNAAVNNLSNWTFVVTKAIVTITLAFINFSFTDIVALMGLDELLAADDGVFAAVFNGVFQPLAVLMFLVTGAYVFWQGAVKKAYREALGQALKTVILFIAAIIVSLNPLWFISMPNNIAVTIQAAILGVMSGASSEEIAAGGLCTTEMGSRSLDSMDETGELTEQQDIISYTSDNVRSQIGCRFWQTFLFEPWVQGQYGTSWENLWATEDTIPEWSADGKTMGNGNTEMVGNAEVPLGEGTTLHNWALYQISTQTNYHSPTGHPGLMPMTSNGVANDWWRIVDATSDYQEVEKTFPFDTTENNPDEVTYDAPAGNPTTPYWSQWTGNNMWDRLWNASSSVIIAVVGVAAPLLFASMTAIYSVGVSLLMALAPIFLLLGCWAGRGWEMFKSWGQLVLNTTMKRLGTAIMLSLSLIITVAILNMMATIGWVMAVILLVLASVLIIKFRSKLFDLMASFRFASHDMGATMGSVNNKVKDMTVRPAQKVTGVAASTATYAAATKRAGGNFTDGLRDGLKHEIKQMSYGNKNMRMAMTSYESTKLDLGRDAFASQEYCASCGRELEDSANKMETDVFHGGRDPEGRLICFNCMTQGFVPDATEVIHHSNEKSKEERYNTPLLGSKARKEKIANDNKVRQAFDDMFNTTDNVDTRELVKKGEQRKNKSDFNNEGSNLAYNYIKSDIPEGMDKKKTEEILERKRKAMFDLMPNMATDINRMKEYSDKIDAVEVPEEIKDYIDPSALARAWKDRNFEVIKAEYATAFLEWFSDHAQEAADEVKVEDLIAAMNGNGNKKKEGS